MSSLSVPAQTDAEYSSIASNQCSWAAAEFVLASYALRHFYKDNQALFLEIYKSCLQRASELRASAGKTHLYGENIDTPELVEHYKPLICCSDVNSYKANTSEEFVSILHADLAREFYTRTYTERDPASVLKEVAGSQCLLVSRHGQSLAVIPYFGKYLICDSHLHEATIATFEDTLAHIRMDHGGHLHLTMRLVSPL